MVVRTKPLFVMLGLFVLHKFKLVIETSLTVMALNTILCVFLSVINIIKPMISSSMFYHIVVGRKYCVTAVTSVLCAVHVHHVVDMCVFVISYEVTVVTFD